MTIQHFKRNLALALAVMAFTFMAAEIAVASHGAESKRPAQTIVVLGDSLTAGFGLDLKEAYPALVQQKIDQHGWNFKVINAGVSGDTSSGGVRRIEWLLRRKVDVLVLELGANDGLRGIPVETTKQNLKTIIARTRTKFPQATIILAGQKMPPNMGEDYGRKFEQVFSDVAREARVALIPFLLEGVGGNPQLNLPDQIHPTAEGQRIVAENVWRILKPLLETRVAEKGS